MRHLSLIDNDIRQTRKQSLEVDEVIYSIREQHRRMLVRRDTLTDQIREIRSELGRASDIVQEKLADEAELSEYIKLDSQRLNELRYTLQTALDQRDLVSAQMARAGNASEVARAELSGGLIELENAKRLHVSELEHFDSVIKSIEQRDLELESVAREYSFAQLRLAEKQQLANSLQESLNCLEKSNAKKRVQISDGQRRVFKLAQTVHERESHSKSENERNVYICENLALARKDIETERVRCEQSETDVSQSWEDLGQVAKILKTENEKFASIRESFVLDDQLVTARKLLEDSHSAVKFVENSIRGIKDRIFVESGKLAAQNDENKFLKTKLRAIQTELENELPREIRNLETFNGKTDVSILNLQYSLELSRGKFNLLAGEKTTRNEQNELTERLAELNKQTTETKSVFAVLSNHLNVKMSELKNSERILSLINIERELCRLNELEIENASIERVLEERNSERERILIARDKSVCELNECRETLKKDIGRLGEWLAESEAKAAAANAEKQRNEEQAERLRNMKKELDAQKHLLTLRLNDERKEIALLAFSFKTCVESREVEKITKAATIRQNLMEKHSELQSAIAEAQYELNSLQTAKKQLALTRST